VRVEIRMNAEQRAIIQDHAEAHSESLNGFINRAIDHEMERDGQREPTEAAEGPGNIPTP